VWEWQDLYITSGFKSDKGSQIIPQTIQKLKAVTQPQIECVCMENLTDALRNVFVQSSCLSWKSYLNPQAPSVEKI